MKRTFLQKNNVLDFTTPYSDPFFKDFMAKLVFVNISSEGAGSESGTHVLPGLGTGSL